MTGNTNDRKISYRVISQQVKMPDFIRSTFLIKARGSKCEGGRKKLTVKRVQGQELHLSPKTSAVCLRAAPTGQARVVLTRPGTPHHWYTVREPYVSMTAAPLPFTELSPHVKIATQVPPLRTDRVPYSDAHTREIMLRKINESHTT